MSGDIFVAESKIEDALVGPLAKITYVTNDPFTADKMLSAGMGLSSSEWQTPDNVNKSDLEEYYGLSDIKPWKVKRYYREDEGKNIEIRLIAIQEGTPQIRPAIDGTFVGGLSIGFPIKNSDARETLMHELGFSSVVGVKRLEFSRPDGVTYVSEEVHFTGPENIYVLGVKRPDIFVPVGPLNDTEEIGAPAYSAMCVEDCDATIELFRDVLGYEIRRDMTMTVGEKSGLRLREGSQERFVQAFAPGANTGYIVLLDHMEETKKADNVDDFAPPKRGLAMWSFPTKDIAEVRRRAEVHGVRIRQDLQSRKTLCLPETETVIIETPDGMLMEIYAV